MKGAVWATNMPQFLHSGQCNVLCLSLITHQAKVRLCFSKPLCITQSPVPAGRKEGLGDKVLSYYASRKVLLPSQSVPSRTGGGHTLVC